MSVVLSEVKGSHVLLEVLRSEGVRYIFGNPGTTELPMLDALIGAAGIEYVLGLQESTVVGMADGYALATGRAAFLNLHTAGGLGNAMGNLTNSASTNTPLVVTAGQQDYRHIVSDPLLSGDLVGIARPVSKWAHEVRTLSELGIILRRAFHDAASAPQGPVFVSLPMHLMDELGDAGLASEPTQLRRANVAEGLDDLAAMLVDTPGDKLAIVAGDEAAAAGDLVVALAEALGARVYGSPMTQTNPLPTAHPLFSGYLQPAAVAIRAALEPYSHVLLIGGKAFMTYPYTPGATLPPGLQLLHLSPDAAQIGRTYPARLGLVGDPAASLEKLLESVRARLRDLDEIRLRRSLLDRAKLESVAAFERERRAVKNELALLPTRPRVAALELLEGLPPDAYVVDEGPATSQSVRQFFATTAARRYFANRGGSLGWGMPAALGVSLGFEGAPVLCTVGDGSALYAPQALWTAAHLELPVVFAVVNNREYGILKNYMRAQPDYESAKRDEFIAMDVTRPSVDYVKLAESFGVAAHRVEKAGDIAAQTAAAFKTGGPVLLEIPIAPSGEVGRK